MRLIKSNIWFRPSLLTKYQQAYVPWTSSLQWQHCGPHCGGSSAKWQIWCVIAKMQKETGHLVLHHFALTWTSCWHDVCADTPSSPMFTQWGGCHKQSALRLSSPIPMSVCASSSACNVSTSKFLWHNYLSPSRWTALLLHEWHVGCWQVQKKQLITPPQTCQKGY